MNELKALAAGLLQGARTAATVTAGLVGMVLAFAAVCIVWTVAVAAIGALPGPLAIVGLLALCYLACGLMDPTPPWRR